MEGPSRILEPLDTNSLSLSGIGSAGNTFASIKNENSSFEFHTGRELEHSSTGLDHTPLKWRIQKDEFVFNSNSTPVRGGDLFVRDGFAKTRKSGQKRRLKLAGAGPQSAKSVSSLQARISKLDLIDDDNLTSLPIAPPPEPFVPKKQKHPTNEYRMKVHSMERRISLNPRIDRSTETDSECEQNELVLIEDYLPRGTEKGVEGSGFTGCGCKRVSISDLKLRYNKRTQVNKLPLRLKKSIHIMQDVSTGIPETPNVLGGIIQPKEHTGLDQYLNGMLKVSSLKHCVICEKPLYELSSRLHLSGRDFQEIVCFSCTSKYEEAARLLEDYEFETSFDDTVDTERNDSMDSRDFQDQPEVVVERSAKRSRKSEFSAQLFHTLQSVQAKTEDIGALNTPSNRTSRFVDSNTTMWFNEAKRKLRWRWRVSGLLPKFLSSSFQTAHDIDRE